jgi:nucleoside phosphorylase
LVSSNPAFLFVTANENEKSALEYVFHKEDTKYCMGAPYFVGSFGSYRIAHFHMSVQGTSNPASTPLVGEIIRALRPAAVIMVGLAFGADIERQKIGDVLVSEKILGYDPGKERDGHSIYKEDPKEVGFQLLNAFAYSGDWNHALPDGEKANVVVGSILTGSKLIDDKAFRDKLLSEFREHSPIGGEMEAFGIYAQCKLHGIAEWIIVKGICDWGFKKQSVGEDSKQEYQVQAAKAAVSFCHSVFRRHGIFDDLLKTHCGEMSGSHNGICENKNNKTLGLEKPKKALPERTAQKGFKIGFTFTGKHRRRVESIANALLKLGFDKKDIFYDKWHDAIINGVNADDKLQKIYTSSCDCVIVFLSKDYADKPWTGGVEWRATKKLINSQQGEKICLLNIDGVDIDSVSGLSSVVDIAKKIDLLSDNEVAEFINAKYRMAIPETNVSSDATAEGKEKHPIDTLLAQVADADILGNYTEELSIAQRAYDLATGMDEDDDRKALYLAKTQLRLADALSKNELDDEAWHHIVGAAQSPELKQDSDRYFSAMCIKAFIALRLKKYRETKGAIEIARQIETDNRSAINLNKTEAFLALGNGENDRALELFNVNLNSATRELAEAGDGESESLTYQGYAVCANDLGIYYRSYVRDPYLACDWFRKSAEALRDKTDFRLDYYRFYLDYVDMLLPCGRAAEAIDEYSEIAQYFFDNNFPDTAAYAYRQQSSAYCQLDPPDMESAEKALSMLWLARCTTKKNMKYYGYSPRYMP